MKFLCCGMVSLSLELSEKRAAALRARANAEGLSVADLVAQALDLDGIDYDFAEADEAAIMTAIAQADRGEVVSEEVALAALRSLSRR